MAKLWDDAELARYAASYPTANQINNAAQAAQKKRGGLVDTLKNAISGFTTGVKDLGTSVVSTLGGGATNNAITAGIDALINKKSFAQAAADANKRQDDFTKWLYNTNSTKDAYAKNLGTALSGSQAALDFIPGVGQSAPVNALQGAMSGAAEQLKANGENADIKQLKNDAIVGAATGAVAGKFGNAVGKLGAKSAKGLGKTLATQVGKGAATGAVAGATGGGLSTLLNGGTLGDALANAGYGAKQGAIAGGAISGAMGLGGTALQKRAGTNQTPTAGPDIEEAAIVNKKRIAPTVEAEEVVTATPTRKGIAVTDYNAGEETIPVNIKRNRQTANKRAAVERPVYYHGSPETDITEFDINRAGRNTRSGEKAIYFTDSPTVADEFSYERIPTDSAFIDKAGKKGKVYEANLKMDNMLDLDNLTDEQIRELWNYASPMGQLDGQENFINKLKDWRDKYHNAQLTKGYLDLEALQKSPYDSFSARMYPNTENMAKEYAVFSNDQIDLLQGNATKPTGKQFIDGVVKGKNLPEADIDYEKRFANEYDTPYKKGYTLAEYIGSGNMGDDTEIFNSLKDAIGAEGIEKLKGLARDGAEFNDPMANNQYGLYDAKTQLPALNRQEAYQLFGKAAAQELPSYMLSNDGRSFNSPAWAETFPQFTNGVGNGSTSITPDEIFDLYKTAAESNKQRVYTTDNIATGLASDADAGRAFTKQIMDFYSPAKKLDIAKTVATAQEIPITTRSIAEPQYTQTTLPARNYEAKTANKAVAPIPEAQIAKKGASIVGKQETALPPKQASQVERELYVAKQKQGAELLSMYGTLDKPTRRAVKDAGAVLVDLYDNYGLETPADVQYAANHVTGADGVVTKATRELAGKAQRVETQIDESWLDNLISENGLTDADAKSVKSQVIGALKRTGADGFSDGNTTLDAMKQLEGIVRDYKGESGTYHNMTDKEKFKVNVIQGVHDELQDRLWDAAGDPSQVLTPARIAELKSYYPDNAKWQSFVDNDLASVKTGQELRAAMKPLVNGAKIVQGGQMSAGGVGDTVVNLAKAGSAKGATKSVAVAAVDKLMNSDKMRQKRAAKYAQEAQIAQSKLSGELPANYKAGLLTGAKNIAGTAADKLRTVAEPATEALNNDYLYNMRLKGDTDFKSFGDIVRRNVNQGIAQEQNARVNQQAQEALANAQAEQEAAQNLADEQYVARRNAEAQALGGGGFGMTQPQSSLDRISNAMELALNAGDINAYNQLAGLYEQAYKINQMQNPQAQAKDAKALSATQSKALAGLQQLETLEQMSPTVRTALANTPLSGVVGLTGGDEYDSQAEALALTIGFLLSGANVKESEAKKIAKSYVPTPFDSEKVRQQKIERARALLTDYMSDTSALQQ